MDALSGAMGGAKKAVAEKAIKTVEDQYETMLPCFLKPFSPCLGGAVETLHACRCAVPEDKKDEFDKAYTSYTDAKETIRNS